MIIYEIYLYIIVSHTNEILLCYISTTGKRTEDRAISWRIET
jgi:hypothetical protein